MTSLPFLEALRARAGDRCELCGGEPGAEDPLAACAVPPGEPTLERTAWLCASCAFALAGAAELDPKRWHCLKESIWSPVPAVQVLSFRALRRLGDESWAREALDQAYLEDEVRAWAEASAAGTLAEEPDEASHVVDCNGNVLSSGDSVTLVRDLDVKGGGFVAKQGTRVNDIRLTDDPRLVEGRVNKVLIVLKTEFLKKA